MWRSLDELDIGMALCGLNFSVLSSDPGFASILRREASSVPGLTVPDVTHPDDCACNERMLNMLRATREPFRITKRYIVRDAPLWVENRVSWLGGEGDEARLLLLSRRLHPREAARAPLTSDEAATAAVTAGYIRDIAAQLARMADQTQLPTTAVALRLAGLLMSEEHEALGMGRRGRSADP